MRVLALLVALLTLGCTTPRVVPQLAVPIPVVPADHLWQEGRVQPRYSLIGAGAVFATSLAPETLAALVQRTAAAAGWAVEETAVPSGNVWRVYVQQSPDADRQKVVILTDHRGAYSYIGDEGGLLPPALVPALQRTVHAYLRGELTAALTRR